MLPNAPGVLKVASQEPRLRAMRRAMNPLYEQMATSVFERMSGLAAKHGAVNLGQGFPDFGWPDEILEAAARALKEGSNQYAPSRGTPGAARSGRGALQSPVRAAARRPTRCA